jgi:branched-chain amino acid transport system permease protein
VTPALRQPSGQRAIGVAAWARPKAIAKCVGFAAIILLGLLVPAVVHSPYVLGLLINAIVLGISAVSIGFLAHQSGLMMFGAAAFTGGATYIYAIALTQFGLPVMLASVLTLLVSTLISALVGAVIVRARPLPFAMLTLALAQLLRSVVLITDLRPLTGGDDGLPLSYEGSFFGISQSQLSKPDGFWPVAWLSFCSVLVLAWAVGRSHLGTVLRATKDNEERMRFSGFDTYAPRVLAFTIACFMAAISGLLTGLYTAFASPELLDFSTGGNALVSTLIGGVGTASGPALGALLYVIGQDRFGATGDLELMTGAGVVLVIFVFPDGVMGFIRSSLASFLNKLDRGTA